MDWLDIDFMLHLYYKYEFELDKEGSCVKIYPFDDDNFCTLNYLLEQSMLAKASDIHLIADNYPIIRINGELRNSVNTINGIFTSEHYISLLTKNNNPKGNLYTTGDADFSYHCYLKNGTVLSTRVNIFKSANGLEGAVRIMPGAIPSMDILGLPTIIKELTAKPNGLILFTAPTGNGKTTSIASIIENINKTAAKRIITIEDPVEYVYTQQKSLISQRNIGDDTVSFAQGLKSALREDPDIIMVGEMRDKETISTALAAAETGHLVFSTLHSGNVVQAIDRLTQYFTANEQNQILNELANSFLAIIAQKLLPRKDNNDRVAAFEVLLNTQATNNLIRSGKAYTLEGYMNSNQGMQTMQEAINSLITRGIIAAYH